VKIINVIVWIPVRIPNRSERGLFIEIKIQKVSESLKKHEINIRVAYLTLISKHLYK
jgi:hypothetical protein